MDALSYQGVKVTDYYGQLQSLLKKKLRGEHALLFAEPMHDEIRHVTDWYTDARGPVQPLADLPEAEQGRVLTQISSLGNDIYAYGQELIADGTGPNVLRGHLLMLATQFPDIANIYLVGGQPVLTCWGFNPGVHGAKPQELSRVGMLVPARPLADAAPPMTATAVVGEERTGGRSGWGTFFFLLKLAFLLLLLLVLLGLLLSSPGCSQLNSFLLPWFRPHAEFSGPSFHLSPRQNEALARELDWEQQLRSEIDALTLQLENKRKLCRKSAPQAESRQEALPERVEPSPTPAPAPEPVPAPTPPPAPADPPEQAQKMEIPDAAKSLDFLEGCWTADTGLVNMTDNRPVVVRYCFDNAGKGDVSVKEKGGTLCKGKASAVLKDGVVSIKAGEAPCGKNKGGYTKHNVKCRQKNNGTLCEGKHPGGPTWNAPFERSLKQ
jgi:hypothetical protein